MQENAVPPVSSLLVDMRMRVPAVTYGGQTHIVSPTYDLYHSRQYGKYKR